MPVRPYSFNTVPPAAHNGLVNFSRTTRNIAPGSPWTQTARKVQFEPKRRLRPPLRLVLFRRHFEARGVVHVSHTELGQLVADREASGQAQALELAHEQLELGARDVDLPGQGPRNSLRVLLDKTQRLQRPGPQGELASSLAQRFAISSMGSAGFLSTSGDQWKATRCSSVSGVKGGAGVAGAERYQRLGVRLPYFTCVGVRDVGHAHGAHVVDDDVTGASSQEPRLYCLPALT